jgi:hypothetical protein
VRGLRGGRIGIGLTLTLPLSPAYRQAGIEGEEEKGKASIYFRNLETSQKGNDLLYWGKPR